VIDIRNGDAASLKRIHEEINVLRVLGHNTHITSLLNSDDSLPNCIRLVMELCEGGELYDRIQQKHFYPEMEAKTCMHNLLSGITYVHGKGIMHRDLKPENILLKSKVSNTDVKISDFGLARMSRNFPEKLPRATSICGSDFYLAPEVIRQEEYGREIDIWALGVIAYVLLCGSLPFFHSLLHKLYRKIVERDLSFSEQAWKQVSKGGMDFVLRLLQARPGDRPTAQSSVTHPWLRSSAPLDNCSFSSSSDSHANYYSDRRHRHDSTGSSSSSDLHRLATQSTQNPLEHAHRVDNSEGSWRRSGSQKRISTHKYQSSPTRHDVLESDRPGSRRSSRK